jgi:hypothetical protein
MYRSVSAIQQQFAYRFDVPSKGEGYAVQLYPEVLI